MRQSPREQKNQETTNTSTHENSPFESIPIQSEQLDIEWPRSNTTSNEQVSSLPRLPPSSIDFCSRCQITTFMIGTGSPPLNSYSIGAMKAIQRPPITHLLGLRQALWRQEGRFHKIGSGREPLNGGGVAGSLPKRKRVLCSVKEHSGIGGRAQSRGEPCVPLIEWKGKGQYR
ncbi:pentatricopeptide repeat (PPR) superfamily protein [Striga asiatica]|uniref:Pentatricopeptide repeat (PPR) superfamily protein n=1 Tax=Striga asiatica TaxID=4170 RepID=A0A5A7Q2M3_STRAF|nr:pentatricopeptide repeat (PPR) superfamily protein [Striga asiatica]